MTHNSELCPVCKKVGDFATTYDTIQFFSEHESVGIHLQITSIGEVVEIGFDKRKFLVEARGLLHAMEATGEPGRLTQHLIDLKRICHKALKGDK